ncbi:MAG TPA: cytochrome c [Phycisphaerae bacterium]|nr:cytochrome c [Phycisphaerae bacterium]HOM49775.1 cytochrome c [Phycisphaerae bacterium]HPP25144.1 cytochrome c [Phycisphaerae bacterium]HPZ99366.1 cytochrome c [Phycisphaerae bacterium]HQE26372.1 cytochrome c [Phycisphaerae bacterium]
MDRPQVPRWIIYVVLIAVVLSWLPLALIVRARAVRSDETRVQIFQDMDNQPRYNPQAPSAVFADGRAMRPEIPGTVARGQLQDDERIYRGQVNGEWVTEIPLPVTEAFVRRGQERYAIFCSPCHGLNGEGTGPIHQRATNRGEPRWIPPTSLLSSQVRERPAGHIFNTITNGIRNMAGYGSQIVPEDRWAIVAYVQALQLSRDASVQDVPANERDRLR